MANNKCEIRIYDKDFNWVGAAANCTSVQFKREMYSVGRFEIHIPASHPAAAEMIKRGNIIVINSDYKKSGVIRSFSLKEGRNGAEITVCGDTGQGFAKQRRIVPPAQAQEPGTLGYDKASGSGESILKHYIQRHMVSPFDEKRKFEYMVIADNQNRGSEFSWRARFTSLDGELSAIAEYGGIGWEIYADIAVKKWVCDVYEGADRTSGQQELSPVVFRLEYQNVDSYTYSEDYQQFKNTGYAGGKGTDENRLIYTLGADNSGQERWETFLDCANAGNIDELKYYGEQKMADMTEAKSVSLDALPKVFVYGTDYFLGDLVSVILPRLDLRVDARVTCVNEIWEHASGYKCEIRLGKRLPNIITALKYKEEVY